MRPPRCNRAREWVSLSLDGELSEFEQILLAAHLELCAGCRAFEADARGFTTSLRVSEPEPLARPISVPRRRSFGVAAVRGAQVASIGLAAAAALLGVVLLPERTNLRVGDDRGTIVAAPPVRSEANELVIEVRRTDLQQQRLRVLPRPSGGIGLVKPPLSAS